MKREPIRVLSSLIVILGVILALVGVLSRVLSLYPGLLDFIQQRFLLPFWSSSARLS